MPGRSLLLRRLRAATNGDPPYFLDQVIDLRGVAVELKFALGLEKRVG